MFKMATVCVSAVFLLTSASLVDAKNRMPPGHAMKKYGSVPGHPGASGYAPGHVKKRSVRGSSRRY